MTLTYRTRRRLQRIGTVALFLLMVFLVFWLCWVIWVERYIVYTKDGANINFDLPYENLSGEVAMPPVAGEGPEIFYNEGENAVNTSTELGQIVGYYITADMLKDMDAVRAKVNSLTANTPVMIDLKGGYGSFFYSTRLEDAVISASTNVAAVDELIELMKSKNLYLIARVSAFQDYSYGLHHVNSGITFSGGRGALWMDNEGCYWLKPTDSAVLTRLSTIILELKGLGFDEVVMDDFLVPEGTRVVYDGDRNADLASAAATLVKNCAGSAFTVSFMTTSSSFALPEGRSRMYLNNIAPKDVEITVASASFADPEIRIVFLANTNDTRFDEYCVLRTLDFVDNE